MTIENGIPHGALVLVADHGKALLLKNSGQMLSPDFEVLEAIEADPNPPTQQQGTDRPGRAAMGTHRSSVGQTDWHKAAAAEFAAKAAAMMMEESRKRDDAPLVIVAPPQALSEVRKALSDGARGLVVAEVNKDLVHMPVTDIAAHLTMH